MMSYLWHLLILMLNLGFFIDLAIWLIFMLSTMCAYYWIEG